MRQDLELQVETLTAQMENANAQISKIEKELAQLQHEIDQSNLEKIKLEQSAQYWQESFKQIESEFLHEK